MTNILRPGDHGAAVTALQQRLTHAGHPVATDGWYGPTTEHAVRTFQSLHNLVTDGIAGSRTLNALRGVIDTKALTQSDIEHAAAQLGCEVAAIQAVIEVENPQGGFLPDGRVVILFERHVFWRQLVANDIDPATLRAPISILSQQRGGYLGGAGEYTRLAQAKVYGAEEAMASCSWGRFQIMGFNATSLGYASASAMADAFTAGEAEHLQAFERLIGQDAELCKTLRTRKWAAFAKGYNGPAYANNLYDVNLARAYARHSDAQQAVSL